MHDALLRREAALQRAGPARVAPRRPGSTARRFEAAFGSDAQMARIRGDVQGAVAAGVDEPPALFLDGERLTTYEPGWLRERLARA